jgi:hypothetical protein
MLCYAMLCYAMLCYAMLCYAMLCYAMLCYAMLCYAMLCYAMLCYAMCVHRSNLAAARRTARVVTCGRGGRYYALLEGLPSVAILAALGEQAGAACPSSYAHRLTFPVCAGGGHLVHARRRGAVDAARRRGGGHPY